MMIGAQMFETSGDGVRCTTAGAARVLVLDDDLGVAGALERCLTSAGFRVRAVTTTEAFKRELRRYEPDVVVIDLRLGSQTALELIESLDGHLDHVGMVLASGVGRRLVDAACDTVQTSGLRRPSAFVKSSSADELVAAVVEALANATAAGTALRTLPVRSPRPVDSEVSAALTAGRIVPYLQPKVRSDDGSLVGFEALARYETAGGQVLGPDAFLAAVERSGRTLELTIRMLSSSLEWLQTLDLDDAAHIAVNLSASSLDESPHALRQLLEVCDRFDVSPERVAVELTESGETLDRCALLRFATQCRLAGFGVSLDDFGVGFSSFSRIADLPFSELKVDRRFVAAAVTDPVALAIVEASVAVARAISAVSTAEGVESVDVLTLIRDLGCDLAQGFLIGRPMPRPQARDWAQVRSGSQCVSADSSRS